MIKTIFSIERGKQSADVILVDPLDTTFATWWARSAYFVTTSSGQFFACPDEEICVEKAKEQVEKGVGPSRRGDRGT